MAETTLLTRRSKRIALRVSLAGAKPSWRDWAGLAPLAVEKIADRLRDEDVADFMRFRLVCKLWMDGSGIRKPRELGARVIDHSFHPRRWILLTDEKKEADEATPTRRMLLNLTTRKTIQVDLPELAGHSVVPGPAAAPEGMLVVRDERSLVVRLLNPLTRHVVDLPTLLTLRPGNRRRGPVPSSFAEDHEVTAAGFADASTIVVYLGNANQLVVARPGDARWTLVGGLDPEFPLRSTATFQSRFYCVDRCQLLVVDMERGPRAQLVVAANLERRYRTVGMVDDGGRLMAVCSRDQVVRADARWMSSLETRVELFHVDLQEEKLSRIEDLGERAVFAGLRGAVLLPSTKYYFSVDRGTVFFRFGSSQRHFGAFHVRRRHTCYIASVWGKLPQRVASYVTTLRYLY
ncbi:uncharacterized protein [Zea mays]|uniref:F-box domain containing protein-like n=2 Tax=Zea mays TaxID=4577 RepID=A0A1D6IMX7_MAIZE|nr:uncharacterized protein LOC103633562 [Zea mays]ONM60635.1 F-box domain containing protein-like [Zea mays]|eukprot:XP_008653469.1 uncharacterized protein LOC103633562 [Zea mays]